ncbi:MAG: hypothetical protein IT440_07295 [Phycisphaeraceae bacterium]|nr:hypothetical protein [Phycisphaeraceae bacterium]
MRKSMQCAMALVLGVSAAAYAGGADQADLATKVNNLQSVVESQAKEIQTLRAAMGDSWLNDRRAEEVKTLVREVLADADTRASLLEGGMNAGHKNGKFFLASEDGSFLLQLSGLIQVRYVYNHRNAAHTNSTASVDEDEMGFEINRAKLLFEGNVINPQIGYALGVQTNTLGEDGEILLDRAYITYKPCDGWEFWVGRRKAPGLREEMVEPGMQLAVDRSVVNELFTLGRVEGLGVTYFPVEALRVNAAVTDGARSGESGSDHGTVFPGNQSGFSNDSTDFGAVVRLDYKVMGDWKQWDDFAAWSGEQTALFVGGGFVYDQIERGDNQASLIGANGIDSIIGWTVDMTFESSGFTFYAAGMGQQTNLTDQAADTGDKENYGMVLQTSYMVIPDKLEPFVRYELISTDDNAVAGGAPSDDLTLLTCGANYYLAKHAAKFTLDVVWVMEPLDATTVAGLPLRNVGLLPDSLEAQDQIAIRAQMQLMF